MNNEQKLPTLPDVIAKIDKAMQTVHDLCSGRIRWTMRVPADHDHDPDLVIADALKAARAAIAAQSGANVQELRAALEAMCTEFRALDLPYGSRAYAAATTVLNKTRTAVQDTQAAIPAGYALVPVEATEAMKDALNRYAQCIGFIEEGYRAMLAAAPSAPAQSDSTSDARDAARYRWLRDNWFTMTSDYKTSISFQTNQQRWSVFTEAQLDAAIDAAMARDEK